MKAIHLTALIFFSTLTIKGFSQVILDPPLKDSLNLIFNEWNSEKDPGGLVAIISDREVIYRNVFGMSDLRKQVPNSIQSPFDLASIAKQFTATCIALLEEQGKISLEDDIKKYYPQFQYADTILIKNLLGHSSGIREAYVLAILSGKVNLKGQVPHRYLTKNFLLEVLSREKDLNFKPGDEMAYTNINYILLGDIVEKVSGMSLGQFTDSAIFKPLGMKNTFFNNNESIVTKGYFYNGKKFRQKTAYGGIVGDHNLISTLDDLILWDLNFYDNRLGKKDPGFISKLCKSTKLKDGNDSGYGYGLFTDDYKGLKQVYHGGDNGVHTSFFLRIPDHNISIICLANSSRYNATKDKAYKIVDALLTASLKTPDVPKVTNFIKLNDSILSPKVGLYYMINESGLGQPRKVTLERGHLYISDHVKVKGLKLNPVTPTHFIAKNPLGEFLHINFSYDDAKNLILHESFWRFKDDKIFHKIKKAEIQPKKFKGTYKNESTGAKIKVKAKNKKIKASKGIISIPLMAFEEDTFYAFNHDALFIFDKDQTGKIIGLTVNAQDFRNFELKRVK